MDNTHIVGLIGERFVQSRLAKFGIDSIKLNSSFDFDIYTTNNLRIEVKTSVLGFKNNSRGKYNYSLVPFYQFHNYKKNKEKMVKRERSCDFFVFVCLNNDFKPHRTYIIPKVKVKDRRNICIYPDSKRKNKWDNYLEKWELLL